MRVKTKLPHEQLLISCMDGKYTRTISNFSLFIFQKYWNIVGLDVIEAVLSVLHLGHCLWKMNFTHIVLIPKRRRSTIYV